MAQHIQVIPYRSEWEEQYKRESSLISDILGSELIEIHHIGSTAVRGLPAKPIIDIMPIVKEVSRIDKFYPQFEAIGYECLGEFGMSCRRYFRKGGDERTHQIHIFEESNTKDINRHLAVRDYLRNHTEVAAEYGRLKAELAKKYPYDIGSYCNGKDNFVKNWKIKLCNGG
ncbi:hypothetical protein K413DRAFT_0377 [Clostridium sp. ASBs410]|nr:hypothetical protein K413DRAFT_0377 [Clostridium sp. ASBs410]